MPKSILRWVAAVAATTCMGCARSNAAAPAAGTTDARIDRVVGGLRPAIAIKGEAPVRWTLPERMRYYHVPGVSVAVIDSGRVAWARGFGVKTAGGTDSVTPATIFQAGSISKPTFALGVMRLVQDGNLDLDANVNDRLTSWRLPDNRFTTHEKVTLRRILSHSAGLTVHGFPGYEAGAPIPTVPQILDGAPPANTAPVRVDTIPGALSRYSGGGLTVAMLLVTDVVKEPFPEFMQETVLGPAGMVHSTYEQPLPAARASEAATGHDGDGNAIKGRYHTYPEMSAAGLWTTPSDLATLGVELERTYAGQSSAVVNQSTLAQMLTVQKAPFGIGYIVSGNGPTLEFSHNGDDAGFVASFVVFAARGQGVAIMTNGQNGGSLIAEIVPGIAAEYGWPDHQQLVRATVPVDSTHLALLSGTYHLVSQPEVLIAITPDTGKLAASVTVKGQSVQRFALYPESDSTFFTIPDGEPVVFARDKGGRGSAMTISGTDKAVR
jgi:CubicO group peptidase (beta-lactamase class C family)